MCCSIRIGFGFLAVSVRAWGCMGSIFYVVLALLERCVVGFRFVRGVGAFVARACVNVDIATAMVRVFCGVGVRDFNRARASSCSRPVASSPPCQTCALLCVVAGAAAKRCFSRVRLFGIAWKVVGYKVEPPLVCDKSVNLERYWPGHYTPPKFLFFLVCFAEPCLHSYMKKLKMLLLCLPTNHGVFFSFLSFGRTSVFTPVSRLLGCSRGGGTAVTSDVVPDVYRCCLHPPDLPNKNPPGPTRFQPVRLPPRLRGCSPIFQLTEQAHNAGRMQTSSVLLRKRPGKNAKSLLGNVNVVICVVRQSTVAVAPAPPKPKPGAVLLDVYLLLLRDESV